MNGEREEKGAKGRHRRNNFKRKKHAGFTLLETLMAVAVMAVLGGILFPRVTGYIRKVEETKYKKEAQAICQAVSLYLLELDAEGIHPKGWELALDICVLFAEEKNHPLLPYLSGAPSEDGYLYSIFYNGTLDSYKGVLYEAGGYSIEARTNGDTELTER